MCVEAVKLPFFFLHFLAAESCLFGFCLVQLHPKLSIQLMESKRIFRSACRGESQLLMGLSSLCSLDKRSAWCLEEKAA